MIGRRQFERLKGFEPHEEGVLSVYLDLSPARQPEREYRIAFKDLVKSLQGQLDESRRERLLEETARVQAWIDTHEPGGKGFFAFACAPAGLFEAQFLQVPLPDLLDFEPRPNLVPLLGVMDDYERYAVAAVDKKTAGLFTVFMGEIEEAERFRYPQPGERGEVVPTQIDAERQHQEAHVHQHLKRVVDALSHELQERRFDRLILAGREEVASELRRMLPKALAERVVATIPYDAGESRDTILGRTIEIERTVERQSEQRRLDEIIDLAAAGGRATCGLAPTLEAIWLGQVEALVVTDSGDGSGSECSNCGRMDPATSERCLVCGAPMRPVEHLVERAIDRTIGQRGTVDLVRDEPARRLEQACEGMAAMLRFR